MEVSAKSLARACLFALVAAVPLVGADTPDADTTDPYLWLEDVGGERALAWVRERNRASTSELEASPDFEAIRSRLLAAYDSNARIPGVVKLGDVYFYNFWRDKDHVRGIWRRTTLEEYRKAEPRWETVLDVDALAAKEQENWVWGGADCIYPRNDRCMVRMSRGGGDIYVVREFDTVARAFVTDGFTVPAAKSRIAWHDRNHLFIGTDFGPGSLTNSGYPRVVKLWQRGTPLADAKTVYEGQASDVSITAGVLEGPGYRHAIVSRDMDFFHSEVSLYEKGRLTLLPIPTDASLDAFRDQMVITLRSDWEVGGRKYPAGAVLATKWQSFVNGKRDFAELFTPGPRLSLDGMMSTRNHVIVNELDNIRNKLYLLTLKGGRWAREAIPTPEGAVSVRAVDEDTTDDYFLNVTGFLTPTSLYLGKVGGERELLKQLPAFFNASGLTVSQHEAVSADGTRIPYFQVAKADLALDGNNATLLTAYGGFEVSSLPNYSAGVGLAWLERGGVYVLANIRGGGEFGPSWHQTAIREHRQRAFDDFAAVAADLVARKVTAPGHLGISGGSNGGLLMGVSFTEHPELFGAVVCQVPLLDMRRYHRLLAGASWMAEYGDPDKPADWEFMSKYSPYQNVAKDKRYPRILFTTSTRDDRVHPGHARKMTARMLEQGHDVLLYENVEGGHGGAANNQQQAYMGALAYTFLWKQLK